MQQAAWNLVITVANIRVKAVTIDTVNSKNQGQMVIMVVITN